MKPITFLRKALRREKKSPPRNSSAEAFSLDISPSPFQKQDSRGNDSMLSLDLHATLQPQVTKVHIPLGTADIHAIPSLQGKHGSLFQSAVHGPPENTSHGPAFLNFQNAPRRPSRPPSLNLTSPPPSPVQRSPTRVKFAPEPQLKTLLPPSPLHQVFLPTPCQNNTLPPVFNHDIPGLECASFEDTTAPYTNTGSLSLTRSTSTARVVLDPTPDQRVFTRTNSSSPHLPLTKLRPRTEPQVQRERLTSSQASYPTPPLSPLRVRRRPQPLVLLPTPAIVPLPPSPLKSLDFTPLATPTATESLPSPRPLKFSGRPLHAITPPRYSPPSGPLPTPPTSPISISHPGKPLRPKPRKTLRIAQSTSGLRDHSFDVSYGSHRTTSSAPSPKAFAQNYTRRRADSTPSSESDSSSLELFQFNDISHHSSHGDVEPACLESRIQWGYAL